MRYVLLLCLWLSLSASTENETQELWILAEGMGRRVLFFCLLNCCLPHAYFFHLNLVPLWSCFPGPVSHKLLVLGNSLCCSSAKSFLSPSAMLLKFQQREDHSHCCLRSATRRSNGKENPAQTWIWQAPGSKGVCE